MNNNQTSEDKDLFPVDLIEISKNIAKEKGIEAEEILVAMETAIAKAGRSKYGQEFDIRAHVDRENGRIGLYRYLEAVENLDNEPEEERINKINLDDAKKKMNVSKLVNF